MPITEAHKKQVLSQINKNDEFLENDRKFLISAYSSRDKLKILVEDIDSDFFDYGTEYIVTVGPAIVEIALEQIEEELDEDGEVITEAEEDLTFNYINYQGDLGDDVDSSYCYLVFMPKKNGTEWEDKPVTMSVEEVTKLMEDWGIDE